MQVPTGVPTLTVAVSLREVQETSFRALVAAGASAGEATLAAQQVLYAELHHGDGLRGLAHELDAGPWPQRGLRSTAVDLDGWTVLGVNCSDRRGPLRCAVLLAELVAASPPGTAIVADGADRLDALVDHALLRAATANGSAVAAVEKRSGLVRAATPEGAVGLGTLELLDGVEPPAAPPEVGVVLLRPLRLDLSAGTWLTQDQIRHRRREAARTGLLVESHLWERAYGASRAYLVPES